MYVTSNGNPESGPNDGLYFISQSTVNGPAGTVQATFVHGYSGFTDLGTNVFPTTILLPVTIEEFGVDKDGSAALLNWKTSSELNAAHFEIQRSADGINFTSIGSKNACGYTADTKTYQYSDPIGGSTGNIYYRLKTVDTDGKFFFSKIVVLRTGVSEMKDFMVYPNPFKSDIRIQVNATINTEASLRLTNAAGQTIIYKKVQIQKGTNIIVLTDEISKTATGSYILEVTTGDEKHFSKLIKR